MEHTHARVDTEKQSTRNARNGTSKKHHKDDNEETDVTSVAATLTNSPRQGHPNLLSLEEVRREIAEVQPANFNADQTEKMRSVLSENIHVFTNPRNELDLCTHAEHTIDLSDNTPVRMQPYTTSDVNRKFIREETEDWLKRGIIRKSKSACASPVIVVDQPHHESTPKRMCVDYRFLNAKTTKRAYPMPRIDTLLRKVSGSQLFSKLDEKKAFLNVPIRESDIEKAAFVTEDGHYEPTRMIFGLCTAPSTMQSIMDYGLKPFIDSGHVIVYMDDICIFTNDIEQHIRTVNDVLKKFTDLNLRVDFRKCTFAADSISFLGYIISRD